jgi:hypothetical protein
LERGKEFETGLAPPFDKLRASLSLRTPLLGKMSIVFGKTQVTA